MELNQGDLQIPLLHVGYDPVILQASFLMGMLSAARAEAEAELVAGHLASKQANLHRRELVILHAFAACTRASLAQLNRAGAQDGMRTEALRCAALARQLAGLSSRWTSDRRNGMLKPGLLCDIAHLHARALLDQQDCVHATRAAEDLSLAQLCLARDDVEVARRYAAEVEANGTAAECLPLSALTRVASPPASSASLDMLVRGSFDGSTQAWADVRRDIGLGRQLFYVHVSKCGGASIVYSMPAEFQQRFWPTEQQHVDRDPTPAPWSEERGLGTILWLPTGQHCDQLGYDNVGVTHYTLDEFTACGVVPSADFFETRSQLVMCVVRDPIDRFISELNMFSPGRSLTEAERDDMIDAKIQLCESLDPSFYHDGWAHCRPQVDYLRSQLPQRGGVACDVVLDISEIDTKGAQLMAAFGIKMMKQRGNVAPRQGRLVTNVGQLRPRHLLWVKARFHEDVEMFAALRAQRLERQWVKEGEPAPQYQKVKRQRRRRVAPETKHEL